MRPDSTRGSRFSLETLHSVQFSHHDWDPCATLGIHVTAWDPCATLISPHLLHYHVRHKLQTPCVRATCGSSFARRLTFAIMAMKVKMPKCVNYRKCGRQAKGPYARFCLPCFVANSKLRGSESSGNSRASGSPRNAGNSSGNLGNAGNSSGNPGNAGNSSGNPVNRGNVKKGKVKKDAGKRSGLRRSAKKALVVKEKWLVFILASQKTW